MAGARRSGRERGKPDPIDALAVARATLREPNLPVARLDGAAREVRLLVDHREDLVTERTRLQSRLRWHLHELFPGLEIPLKRLRNEPMLTALDERLTPVSGIVADIARELVARCRALNRRVNDLAHQIGRMVRRLAPSLLSLPGCGELSAAKIIGEVAGAERFRSRAAFARWNGTAPIPVWSSNTTRHRLNRGGNRQVNAALHRIAIYSVAWPWAGTSVCAATDGGRRVGYATGKGRIESWRPGWGPSPSPPSQGRGMSPPRVPAPCFWRARRMPARRSRSTRSSVCSATRDC
jgi:transposase